MHIVKYFLISSKIAPTICPRFYAVFINKLDNVSISLVECPGPKPIVIDWEIPLFWENSILILYRFSKHQEKWRGLKVRWVILKIYLWRSTFWGFLRNDGNIPFCNEGFIKCLNDYKIDGSTDLNTFVWKPCKHASQIFDSHWNVKEMYRNSYHWLSRLHMGPR